MNEQIEKLEKQSYTEFMHERGGTYQAFDKQKFAELIVAECSKVIVNGGYWSGGPLGPKRQCTPPEIAQMIKEYFGVEE